MWHKTLIFSPNIPELKECAASLSSVVGNAADIGNQLSGKVRQLDLAKVKNLFLDLLY